MPTCVRVHGPAAATMTVVASENAQKLYMLINSTTLKGGKRHLALFCFWTNGGRLSTPKQVGSNFPPQ